MEQKIQIFLFEAEREAFLKKHNFMFKESQARILSNFNNIDKETDLLRDQLLNGELYNSNPNLYHDDEAQLYEDACSQAFSHYSLLHEMRRELTLTAVSIIYFNFDKTLRSWLFKEIEHSWNIPDLENWIWRTDIKHIYSLLELFDFSIRSKIFFKHVDSLRIIVNTYKHGYGLSLSQLKDLYPEYLNAEFVEKGFMTLNNEHNNLKVSKPQLEEFAQAITDFWTLLPRNLICDDIQLITQLIQPKNKKKKEA